MGSTSSASATAARSPPERPSSPPAPTTAGSTHLEEATVEHNPTGTRSSRPCAGLFCFIGAVPATGWLCEGILLDRDGSVLTDRSLPEDVAGSLEFAGRAPLPFETAVPGV